MHLNNMMAGRLNQLCEREILVHPIEQFLDVWMSRNTSLRVCSDVLRWLCSRLDEMGEYHASEVLIKEGDDLLSQERLKKDANGRTVVVVVVGAFAFALGLLVGGARTD